MSQGERREKGIYRKGVGDKNRGKACGNGGAGRTKTEEIQRRGIVD